MNKSNRFYKKKKYTYQIVTNSGETVGLPLDNFKVAENILDAILNDEMYLADLCPDTDIQTIKYLTIEVYEEFKKEV